MRTLISEEMKKQTFTLTLVAIKFNLYSLDYIEILNGNYLYCYPTHTPNLTPLLIPLEEIP